MRNWKERIEERVKGKGRKQLLKQNVIMDVKLLSEK